jgi:hypothetical protein
MDGLMRAEVNINSSARGFDAIFVSSVPPAFAYAQLSNLFVIVWWRAPKLCGFIYHLRHQNRRNGKCVENKQKSVFALDLGFACMPLLLKLLKKVLRTSRATTTATVDDTVNKLGLLARSCCLHEEKQSYLCPHHK